MKKRVLVVDSVHPCLFEILKTEQVELDYKPDIKPDAVLSIIENYEGLITNSKLRINRAFLEKARRLEFAIRAGSGLDIFDLEAAEELGVKCYNTPEGNKDAVAEHALGFLLALLNNICKANNEVRNWNWQREENRGKELNEMTVGIIGFGQNGSAFARLLAAMGCKVLAYDKYKTGFSEVGIEEVEMEAIFAQADVLSLHIPLTSETKNLIDLKFLERFQRKIHFINCSRGKTVSLKDLNLAFDQGLILGAALDVLENESFEKLEEMEKNTLKSLFSKNVIFTPHIAGWTIESKRKISECLAAKLKSNL